MSCRTRFEMLPRIAVPEDATGPAGAGARSMSIEGQTQIEYFFPLGGDLGDDSAAPPSPLTTYSPATPEPGVDIPAGQRHRFGTCVPMPTTPFFVIGMEKGWFKDVGITISPRALRLEDDREAMGVAAAQPAGRHQLGDLLQAAPLLQEHRPAQMRGLRRHLLRRGHARQSEARAEEASPTT